MIVTGKLIHVSEVKTGTSAQGKEWSNLTAVFETEEQYPKKVPIEFRAIELINLIQNTKIGTVMTVHINIDGREHEGRWYASVKGWKI